MIRGCLLAFAAVTFFGCYTPKGAFVSVEDFELNPAGEYRVASGDVLQVRVFQHDEVSAKVRVRTDGKVSLPMVNDVMAAGKTPAGLASELQVKFKDFLNNPFVTVSLEESRPLMVSVLGEVSKAGVVTLEAGSGVLQALAAAGGLNDFAHRDSLFVLRKVPGQAAPTRIRFTWEGLARGEGRAARFTLLAGDVVVAE